MKTFKKLVILTVCKNVVKLFMVVALLVVGLDENQQYKMMVTTTICKNIVK